MALSGFLAKRVTEALRRSFPSYTELRRMVKFGLDVNLNDISRSNANLQDAVFDLVQWADSHGQLQQLYIAAKQENPAFPLTLADFGSAAQGVSFQPPPLPNTFVERPLEYKRLRDLILSPNPTRSGRLTTALQATAGFGKTTLAAALCADPDIRSAFSDGIWWVTLGEQPNILELLGGLTTAALSYPPVAADLDGLERVLSEGWQGKRVLLVLDDAWSDGDVASLIRAGQHCTRLVITRNLAAVPKARWIRIQEMQTDEASALLAAHLVDPPLDLSVLEPLARQLGEWPLLLTLAGPVLQQRLALDYSLEQALEYIVTFLQRKGVTAFDHADATARRTALAGTMGLSVERLAPEQRICYAQLGIFPEDQAIPLDVTGLLWEKDAFDTEELVSTLAMRSLLTFDPTTRTLRLHDVIRRYLIAQITDPAAAHAKLITAWGDLCWVPISQTYAWRWMSYHLLEAGQVQKWRAIMIPMDNTAKRPDLK